MILFDIDGVLVSTWVDRQRRPRKIFGLHADLLGFLDALRIPYGFLTHRSRREALQILSALGVRAGAVTLLVCANDMAREALRTLGLKTLLADGIQKKYAVPLVCRRAGMDPGRIAVIDDLQINLDRLAEKKIGLLIKSPGSPTVASRTAATFDLNALHEVIGSWMRGNGDRHIRLPEIRIHLDDDLAIGCVSGTKIAGGFELIRTLGRHLRRVRARAGHNTDGASG